MTIKERVQFRIKFWTERIEKIIDEINKKSDNSVDKIINDARMLEKYKIKLSELEAIKDQLNG